MEGNTAPGGQGAPDGGLKTRWATILAADVVGYSRLMGEDPAHTVTELEAVRSIVKEQCASYGGYVADHAGDSILAVFDTAVGAVYAARASQQEIALRAAGLPDGRRMFLRMGLHLGDILEQADGTVYGNDVNIAARLESLAPTGGITVSEEVREACAAAGALNFIDQGEYQVKNIARPLRVLLLAQEGGAEALGAAQVKSRSVAEGNLPLRSTGLIGRSDALREISSLLNGARLVTLLGMGGMGKTSLSVEAARLGAHDFPDGAWFVDLGAVADGSAVGLAVAGVFGVAQQSGKSIEESLVEALRGRRMLIVLDNCEHVTRDAAALADAVLSACPKISIIATSRELLSVNGEKVLRVEPLGVSGGQSPAVQLFEERAGAVSPGFDPARHQEDVRAICEALDGIPLAIELAAARVKSLSPRQIRDRLGQRFRLLSGGAHAGARERHQTLRNLVQWSYDLLNETETAVLERASVFAGGFTLEAAEAVCAGEGVDAFDVVDTLDSLVAKSLINVQHGEGAPRYSMLETIRAFGAERLAARPGHEAVYQAHAEFYAAQADETFAIWRSPREGEAYLWLDREINNLRNAFRWAKETGHVDPAARIASSVGDMGRFRLREEAAGWAEEIVEAARAARHPRLTVLLTWCASSAWAFSRFEDAQRFGEDALALLDDPHFEPFVWAYGDLAFVALFSGDVDKAIDLLATGARHPADALDRFIMAFHLYIMATAGRGAEALEIAEDVVAKVDARGVPMAMAIAHGARAGLLEASDPEAALAEYEHAISVAKQSGARFMETLIAPHLAALQARTGEPRAALEGFERMLLAFGDATDMASVSAWRTSLVVLFARTGQFQAAATLHGTLVDLIDQSSLMPEHAEAVARVREALGTKAFSAATQTGAAMGLREATDYAIAQVQLGLESFDLKMSS